MKNLGEMLSSDIVSGPEVWKQTEHKGEIKGLTEKDLRVVVPQMNGTILILQRNAKDQRIRETTDFGALKPEAIESTRETGKKFFLELFEKMPENEKRNIEILVISSDSMLHTPEGVNSPHKRGLETAEAIIQGIREAMSKAGVEEKQLLNTSEFAEYTHSSGPVEFSELKDLEMMTESPEFVEYLKTIYGTGREFWEAFESDTQKEVREQMRVEGPDAIAERMRHFLWLITKAAQQRHKDQPGKRLIIWTVSHYDAISPFVKKRVLKRPITDYFPIDAGGGFTMEISAGGEYKTQIGTQEFAVDL